jgi:hypothetical protein
MKDKILRSALNKVLRHVDGKLFYARTIGVTTPINEVITDLTDEEIECLRSMVTDYSWVG